jgi:HSP20 family molecular chaperone IbpA
MTVETSPEALLPTTAPITETELEYRVAVEVPGFAPADLRVEIEDHELTIHGEDASHRLDRSIQLPLDADVEWLAALYEPGLLEFHVAKLGPSALGRRPVEIAVRQ